MQFIPFEAHITSKKIIYINIYKTLEETTANKGYWLLTNTMEVEKFNIFLVKKLPSRVIP